MFLYSHWMRIPLSTRNKIAVQFGIAKVGSTHVSNNVVISDGYKIEDVERVLNIDAIQSYVGVDHTDTATLFTLLVAKIEGVIVESPKEEVIETPVVEVVGKIIKRRGRQAKLK